MKTGNKKKIKKRINKEEPKIKINEEDKNIITITVKENNKKTIIG